MDKSEILKLVLAKTDNLDEALAAAQKIVNFLQDDQAAVPPPQPVQQAPSPAAVPATPSSPQLFKLDPYAKPANNNRAWREEDKISAGKMIDEGTPIHKVAEVMQRTESAVYKAWMAGIIKTSRPFPRKFQYRPRGSYVAGYQAPQNQNESQN